MENASKEIQQILYDTFKKEGFIMVLLDHDNTQAGTEDVAMRAQHSLTSKLFSLKNINNLPQEIADEDLYVETFKGRTYKETLEKFTKYGVKLTSEEIQEYVEQEREDVIKAFAEKEVKALPGSIEIAQMISEHQKENPDNFKISCATVTSSKLKRVNISMKSCGLNDFFNNEDSNAFNIYSGTDEIEKGTITRSKPSGEIFLHAINKEIEKNNEILSFNNQIDPINTPVTFLILEDSVSGIKSGNAAKKELKNKNNNLSVIVIGVTAASNNPEKDAQNLLSQGANYVLPTLCDLNDSIIEAKMRFEAEKKKESVLDYGNLFRILDVGKIRS